MQNLLSGWKLQRLIPVNGEACLEVCKEQIPLIQVIGVLSTHIVGP